MSNAKFPLKSLPLRYQIENAFVAMNKPYTSPLILSAVIQWCVNTWKAEHKTWRKKGGKGIFIPTMPRTVKIFNYLCGESCAEIRDRLRAYGIPGQLTGLSHVLWPDGMGIGLECQWLVPGPQYDMADAILHQFSGSAYSVLSPPGKLRRYQFKRPWGVPAKARSWDETVTNFVLDMFVSRSSVSHKRNGRDVEQKRRKQRLHQK